ncbi:LysR family transcriptional regulator [Microvirga pakistanensis]|uniref:LysR family transcriptional regulator n=1 Tax=Microvirga pakistanensis TaxID=1682650 RepID=UPI001069797B|nr:LysR family transcriptional regulator [Microvirga pakistanensis]
MFDWDDLRHFAVLADEGSLSAAARRLRVEHATVARRVAALEAAVGVKLVDRRSGRYVLTPDGDRVAEYARRIEAETLSLERMVLARRTGFPAEVSVSAPPLVATLLIAPRLARLRQSHPDLRLRLLGENRTVSLQRREADIALRLVRPSDNTLVTRKVGSIIYALYASRRYLALRRECDFEFIAFDEALDNAPQQVWLRRIAGDRPIVLRTNDLAIQRAAAEAQVGVAVLPTFVGDSGDLQRLETGQAPIVRDVWLTLHRDLRANAAVAATAAFIADCLRQENRSAERSVTDMKKRGIDWPRAGE